MGQVANMEADFLTSLHEVRRMGAEMEQLMAGLQVSWRIYGTFVFAQSFA